MTTEGDTDTSTSEVSWVQIQGLWGLDISYPVFFSLDKDFENREIRLRNNLNWDEISIDIFDADRLAFCAKEFEKPKVVGTMESIALALKDENVQETHVTELEFPNPAAVTFTAYGKVLLPCGRLLAPKTNVVILPREDGLYVVTYDADVPLLHEIALKLKFTELGASQ